MFEFIGIIVVTVALLWITAIPVTYLYIGTFLGAWVPEWKETATLLVGLGLCMVGWYFWWEHIGSNIHVSFN